MLDGFTAMRFVTFAEAEDELVVVGVGRFWRLDGGLRRITACEFPAFDEPGWAKVAFNFRAAGGELSTETRIRATDPASRRKFGRYWRLVMPGSALIRRDWLRAARKESLQPKLRLIPRAKEGQGAQAAPSPQLRQRRLDHCRLHRDGGTSWAVATGSIDSREIRNNTVGSGDVRNNTVRSRDVRNGALIAADFRPGQLPAGAQGPRDHPVPPERQRPWSAWRPQIPG